MSVTTTTTTLMQYGNPTGDAIFWMNKPSFLDALFSDFISANPIDEHKSDTVKQEIALVKSYVDELMGNPELLQRYRVYDRSIIHYVSGLTFPDNEDLTGTYKNIVKELFDDAMPLIYKLKLHYQRPRPYQLSFLNEIPLYPVTCFSDHSPSFPCLYSCIGILLFQVCHNRFPETYRHFKELSEDFYIFRQRLGVCLPSDCDAGRRLAGLIVNNQEFKIKYQL